MLHLVSWLLIASFLSAPLSIHPAPVAARASVETSGSHSVTGAPSLAPAAQPPVNLALGQAASQSSTDWGGVASRAVDGNTNGSWGGGSVTHTQGDFQAWWQVDLGAVRSIGDIVLWNRTDCCGERLNNLVVLVSNSPFVSTSLQEARAQAGVSSYDIPGQVGVSKAVPIARRGRYVRVQFTTANWLSLAEVQVFQGASVPQNESAGASTAGMLLSSGAPVDLIVPPWGATGTNDRIWRYQNGTWVSIAPPQPGWYWVWLEVNPANDNQWLLLGNTTPSYWRKFDVRNSFFTARGSTHSPAYYTPDAGATWLPVQLRHPTHTAVSSGTYSCADLVSIHWNTEPANSWTAVGFADGHCPNMSYAWFGTASTTAATVTNGPHTVSGQAFGPALAGAGAEIAFATQYPGPAYLRVMSPGSTTWTTPSGPAIGYYAAGLTMERGLGASREVALTGDGKLYASADYSQSQPAYRSIGYQGTHITHAAPGRWYLGGRSGGVVEVSNLFGTPSARVVAGGGDTIGFIRSDRATHTTVAARISGTSDHYIGSGANLWFRLAGPPGVPAEQLADRFEVLAAPTLPLDQARNGGCACPSTSHPINTRSGNFWTEVADLAVLTPGPALRWSRLYNSQAITDTDGLLGPGWQHSYSARVLIPTPEPGNLLILSERGNLLRFTDHGDGSYTPFPGVEGTLTREGGSLTYVLRDQSRRSFDGATGQLTTITDARGRQLTLSYTGAPSRLDRVQDAGNAARWLQLSYTPGGQIASVSDGSRAVGYSYDGAGDLVEARDVMDRPTTYTYQAHLLTQITNAIGQVVEEVAYDQYTPQGRAIYQVLQDGRQLALAYLPDTTVITTTSATGQTSVQRYSYTSANTLSRVTTDGQATMAAIFDTSFQPGVVSDGNGNRTSTRYQGNGLPVAQTDALGRTTQILYDSQNRPISTTDSLGITTLLSYDGRGNLLSTTTGITTTSSLRTTSRYTYTYDLHYPGESLLAEQQGADGAVTRFAYNAQGQVSSRTVGFGTPLAQVTTYGYDAQGRVTEVVTGAGTSLARRDRTVYNADNTVAETIQNEQDGVFDPARPDEDVCTRFGYDQLGRQVWTQNALGIYAATHYNAQGQIDWTAQNVVPLQLDSSGQVILPPFDPATPDRNVARLIQYDGLGRTSLVTDTGLLAGTFDPLTRRWSEATTRATRIEYDSLSRPITTTLNYRPDQPVGTLPDVNVQLLQYYDGAGNVIWARDALGRWTFTEYDALNRPVRTTRNFVDGDPLTGTADTDLVTVQTYDGAGRLERQIENYLDGVFAATEPITDRITLVQYDTLNRVTSTTANWAPGLTDPALNRVSSTSYDPATGRMIGQQDALGRWISQQYDELGRTTITTQNCRVSGAAVPTGCASFDPATPDENVPAETRYDALGRPEAFVDALGHETRVSYDGLGRVLATTQNFQDGNFDPAFPDQDVTSRQTYDALGRVVSREDATGATTALTINGLGQTTAITDAMNRVTQSGYDGQGNLRWTATPDGRLSVYGLDGLGRVVTTIQNYQDGAVATNEPVDQDLTSQVVYDAAGRRVQLTDPAGRSTQFAYDQLDRLISVTENATTGTCAQAPCNVVTRYEYDRAGNRTAIIDANGHRRSFSYDAADQQVAALDGLGQQTRWEYDAGGRLTAQRDPRGSGYDLAYSYDGLDRQTRVESAQLAAPIVAGYDSLGQRQSLTDATGTTTLSYDALGRVTGVTAPDTGSVGYGYNARGERVALTYPDASVVQYGYWPDRQLQVVAQGGSALANYSYDPAGRLQQVSRANGATTTYGYDGADRLRDLHITVNGSTLSRFQYSVDRLGLRVGVDETLIPTSGRAISYTYDGLLRLTGVSESTGTTYAYNYDDAGNRTGAWLNGAQVQSLSYNVANQVVGWSYDAAGNLLSDGTTTSTYDALNRLTSRDGTSYSYNGDGVLVAQTTGSTITRYAQDLAAPLSQVLSDGSASYVYGHERLAAQAAGVTTWYAADALGSVRQTLDNAGTPLATASYDPWGTPEGSTISPFGFTGELQDAAGLVHLRARWYTPQTGTLLSRDPFTGFPEQPYSLSPYQYAYSSPVNLVDPSGECVGVLAGLDTVACAAILIGAGIGALALGGAVTAANPPNQAALQDATDGLRILFDEDAQTRARFHAISTAVQAFENLGEMAWRNEGFDLDDESNGIQVLIFVVTSAPCFLNEGFSLRAPSLDDVIRLGPQITGAIEKLRNPGVPLDDGLPVETVSAVRDETLQTGGHTVRDSTAKALNRAHGLNLHSRMWGRALEALKHDLGLGNDHHGKIMKSGDYLDGHTDQWLGNLLDYLP